jgi:ribosome-associated toxin RatA of RatAB toxin-antitoxin module
MTTISRQAIVPYSAAQMFALVNAIESYPDFLPWCRSSEILSQYQDEVRARLDLSRGGLQKSFTTCNRLQPDKMIEIRLIDGPFEHLQGMWRFQPLSADGSGCQILFDLEFKFAGKLVDMAFGPIFQQIANSLVDAFCQRAHALYGNRQT